MDAWEAIYTTRAMRRVKKDPIPVEVQKKILDAAIRAPSGGNTQTWRFLLVDDPAVKAKLGPIYRECMDMVWGSIYNTRLDAAKASPEDPESVEFMKMYRSASHLAEHFEDYPLMLFAFCQFDTSGGSIFPAVWNAMLAARIEGVGSSLTSAFHFKGDAMKKVLGVPEEGNWIFSACVTFGYPTGRWGVAPRRPAHEVSFRNSWDGALGFEIPEPLWSMD
ncbi:MAG: nitroreductase family protein [Spirochaetaceae bacterium]|nr:nitroreductase family protein [Myxococcales bacterium]MCB9724854.1 nitroreductase family protein [Spirochaetaceae bacterium]HPG27623.1 nitroreductase family protein [Myxococcota bacterium]